MRERSSPRLGWRKEAPLAQDMARCQQSLALAVLPLRQELRVRYEARMPFIPIREQNA